LPVKFLIGNLRDGDPDDAIGDYAGGSEEREEGGFREDRHDCFVYSGCVLACRWNDRGGYLLQSTHADRVLPGAAKMKRKSELNGRNSAAAQSDRLTPHVDGTKLTRRVPSLHLLGLSA
jgi:hypothetical protein